MPTSQYRFEKRICSAKCKARSELNTKSDWYSQGYYTNFDVSLSSVHDNIERIDAFKVSIEQFRNDYERIYKPVVIENTQTGWKANKKWSLKHHKRKKLLDDYFVPEYFREDLFALGGERSRPPYRWFVMGPARSGTSIHIDPLGTSAWNALNKGYKRWCLFPPETPKELVKPKLSDYGKNKNEAICWFMHLFPKCRSPSWPEEYKPIEILQRPGETVFVPGGWWHAVINLTDTVAVTQNFCSSVNFPIVWHKTARGRPKFSKRWISALRIHRPDLAKIADQTNLSVSIPCVPSSSSSCSSSSSSCSSCCSTCTSRSPSPSCKAKNCKMNGSTRSPSPKRRC